MAAVNPAGPEPMIIILCTFSILNIRQTFISIYTNISTFPLPPGEGQGEGRTRFTPPHPNPLPASRGEGEIIARALRVSPASFVLLIGLLRNRRENSSCVIERMSSNFGDILFSLGANCSSLVGDKKEFHGQTS